MSTGTPQACHCAAACPALINERRKTGIGIGALESIGTAEARQALRSIAVLDGLKEPTLCLCLHDEDEGEGE